MCSKNKSETHAKQTKNIFFFDFFGDWLQYNTTHQWHHTCYYTAKINKLVYIPFFVKTKKNGTYFNWSRFMTLENKIAASSNLFMLLSSNNVCAYPINEITNITHETLLSKTYIHFFRSFVYLIKYIIFSNK